jgi:hypothetical protein
MKGPPAPQGRLDGGLGSVNPYLRRQHAYTRSRVFMAAGAVSLFATARHRQFEPNEFTGGCMTARRAIAAAGIVVVALLASPAARATV